MFLETVLVDGRTVPRFELDAKEPNSDEPTPFRG
jgi:hypothetical protein